MGKYALVRHKFSLSPVTASPTTTTVTATEVATAATTVTTTAIPTATGVATVTATRTPLRIIVTTTRTPPGITSVGGSLEIEGFHYDYQQGYKYQNK